MTKETEDFHDDQQLGLTLLSSSGRIREQTKESSNGVLIRTPDFSTISPDAAPNSSTALSTRLRPNWKMAYNGIVPWRRPWPLPTSTDNISSETTDLVLYKRLPQIFNADLNLGWSHEPSYRGPEAPEAPEALSNQRGIHDGRWDFSWEECRAAVVIQPAYLTFKPTIKKNRWFQWLSNKLRMWKQPKPDEDVPLLPLAGESANTGWRVKQATRVIPQFVPIPDDDNDTTQSETSEEDRKLLPPPELPPDFLPHSSDIATCQSLYQSFRTCQAIYVQRRRRIERDYRLRDAKLIEESKHEETRLLNPPGPVGGLLPGSSSNILTRRAKAEVILHPSKSTRNAAKRRRCSRGSGFAAVVSESGVKHGNENTNDRRPQASLTSVRVFNTPQANKNLSAYVESDTESQSNVDSLENSRHVTVVSGKPRNRRKKSLEYGPYGRYDERHRGASEAFRENTYTSDLNQKGQKGGKTVAAHLESNEEERQTIYPSNGLRYVSNNSDGTAVQPSKKPRKGVPAYVESDEEDSASASLKRRRPRSNYSDENQEVREGHRSSQKLLNGHTSRAFDIRTISTCSGESDSDGYSSNGHGPRPPAATRRRRFSGKPPSPPRRPIDGSKRVQFQPTCQRSQTTINISSNTESYSEISSSDWGTDDGKSRTEFYGVEDREALEAKRLEVERLYLKLQDEKIAAARRERYREKERERRDFQRQRRLARPPVLIRRGPDDITWFWVCKMDVIAGYWATPWTFQFNPYISLGAAAIVIEALTGMTDREAFQYSEVHPEGAWAWLRQGKSTFPPYSRNAMGGVVMEGLYEPIAFDQFEQKLPPLRLLNCYDYQVSRMAGVDDVSVLNRQLELMGLDSWLSLAGRTPEILNGPANLLRTTPALITKLMQEFGEDFKQLDYTANEGGLQVIQDMTNDLLEAMEDESLNEAEQLFTLVALLRTAKVALCIVLGSNTEDIRGYLSTDIQVFMA